MHLGTLKNLVKLLNLCYLNSKQRAWSDFRRQVYGHIEACAGTIQYICITKNSLPCWPKTSKSLKSTGKLSSSECSWPHPFGKWVLSNVKPANLCPLYSPNMYRKQLISCTCDPLMWLKRRQGLSFTGGRQAAHWKPDTSGHLQSKPPCKWGLLFPHLFAFELKVHEPLSIVSSLFYIFID